MATGTELDSEQSLTNLVRNGSFEEWLASGLPAYWAKKLGGPPEKATDHALSGAASLRLTSVACAWDNLAFDGDSFSEGEDSSASYDAVGNTVTLAEICGKKVTATVSVYKDTGAQPKVTLNDGVTATVSGYGCHANEWQTITVQAVVENTADKLEVTLGVEGEDKSARFDDVMLTLGTSTVAFTPNPGDTSDPAVIDHERCHIEKQTYSHDICPLPFLRRR